MLVIGNVTEFHQKNGHPEEGKGVAALRKLTRRKELMLLVNNWKMLARNKQTKKQTKTDIQEFWFFFAIQIQLFCWGNIHDSVGIKHEV